MIARYTRPEMGRIWSEENGFQKWLEVEILAAEGLATLGKVPKAAVARIRKKARFDVKRIREIEAEVKHEIIAFLSSVAESIGDDARYLTGNTLFVDGGSHLNGVQWDPGLRGWLPSCRTRPGRKLPTPLAACAARPAGSGSAN